MKKRIVVIVGCILFVLVALAVAAQQAAPDCCVLYPTPGPHLTADPTDDAQAALAEIQEVLRHHNCQLGYEARVNGAGVLEPRIRVEQVVFRLKPTTQE